MRGLGWLLLAVTVIAGWTVAAVFLMTTVTQIGVDRVIAPTLCVTAAAGETACSR